MTLTPTALTLYTVQEVADSLRVHTRTVYRLIREGKLKAVKVGSQWRVPEKALLEFVENAGEPVKPKKSKGPKQLTLPLAEE